MMMVADTMMAEHSVIMLVVLNPTVTGGKLRLPDNTSPI